ncbi:coiled-coil domain-containing protein-domain-containing protein [Calycina marina]|uniref:Coiled-coil domain-containing protein-domain-containing protein n=1 Tax=Calycina marina TaxID=1763456 RepID=A0A9P7Z4Y5_9HELO|nr:coiled-coil domain-containing protein-domain-containing protein [Calycina marina]
MPFMEDATISPEQETENRREGIRIKNRRQLYLDRNPSYFTSLDLELADPLLYDRCIRRFQSTAEREVDGRLKGYSGILEADLYRSEAKLDALKVAKSEDDSSQGARDPSSPFISHSRGEDGELLPEDPDEVPESKEDALERWKFAMTLMFLKGDDPDFNYGKVDGNGEWDVIESKEEEDRWFDQEEPDWDGKGPGEEKSGETGIQDF